MMLDKKQIPEIFLFEFEMGHKQWWQLATSTIHLTRGLLTNLQRSGDSRSFAKEIRALKMRSTVAGHWKLTTIDWELSIIDTDSLTVTWEVAEELNIDHSKVVWHLQQIGMVKHLIAGCLMSWLQIKKKNHLFEVSSLIPCNSNEPFLDWIETCDEKWILYHSLLWLAQWLDQEEVAKHFPIPNLHQKKVMVTVWWSIAGLIHNSFLNPGKTIASEKYAQQIGEMHWKLQCTQLVLVNRKGPILLHNEAWPHTAQPTGQLFAGKMLPQPAGCRKCFSRICHISKHVLLCYRNK